MSTTSQPLRRLNGFKAARVAPDKAATPEQSAQAETPIQPQNVEKPEAPANKLTLTQRYSADQSTKMVAAASQLEPAIEQDNATNPKIPAIPKKPAVPNTPSIPNTPAVPEAAALPDTSAAPEMASIPDTPAIPEAVALPNTPATPDAAASKLTLTQRYVAEQSTTVVAAATPEQIPPQPEWKKEPEKPILTPAQARAIQGILRPAYIASTKSVVRTRYKTRHIQHADFWIFFAIIIGLIGLLGIYIFISYHGTKVYYPHEQTRTITLVHTTSVKKI
ncbi:hypothetical protein KDA_38370 [Dictyobacter alpinus]|uniref:Uncharacterized protein n=1 Tax=Dictyobacter alpinus TaxID=2014873 RepID=A0A402BAD9_9CHLR|nr:hypothetical protein [Dictyobacter alpinus]GCE28353.1 hypothetical protein KDA_38370 [Dictyobacter alpinus]